MIKNEQSNFGLDGITIKYTSFSWGFNEEKILNRKTIKGSNIEENRSSSVTDSLILKDIDLKIKQGEFVAIIGEVGSGKTSFIHSLIGDMLFVDPETRDAFRTQFFSTADDQEDKEVIDKRNSEIISKFNDALEQKKEFFRKECPVTLNGKLSLIEQKPWIQNKSIRDNILFGEDLDAERYNHVVEICQLGRDLDILDGGDLTEIGEKGINLSGGQRARISIARAIYTDSDIVLMDDPLSALDAHVKKKIFQKV
jgi:ABC-type multidrug transport system fused ATPase/permease subunit